MSKEIDVPCQTFIRVMQCECGGEMKYEPSEFTTLQHPLKYKHVCNKCGKVEYFTTTYPMQISTYEMPEINLKDEFVECQDCPAWSGSGCTRHPYEEGCLKDGEEVGNE